MTLRTVFSALALVATASQVVAAGTAIRKVQQITGNTDKSLRMPTKTLTQATAKVVSTDLGSTFEHKGRLYFLFGDPLDSFAYTTATSPWAVGDAATPLVFPFLDENGKAVRLQIPGLTDYQALCVSSGGVSYDNAMYVVFTTTKNPGGATMRRSVMGRSLNDGQTWENLYDLSVQGAGGVADMDDTHFINVSMSIVDSAQWPGLPYSGDNLVIFGSGKYRESNAYLAVMPANQIATRSTLRYFAGLSGTTPVWSSAESAAVPLFNETTPQIGEFSAQYIPQLGKWVMLYYAVTMRTADVPWGPWSAPSTIWDPWTWYYGWVENGFGDWLHVPSDFFAGHYDDFGEGDSNGGPYGPYIVPRWTQGDATNAYIYFTMSSHNPYAVYIMRAQIPAPVDPALDPGIVTYNPADAGWTSTAGSWFVPYAGHTNWITTWGSAGEDSVGLRWRWLPRDLKNRSMSFKVSGGDQEVLLLEGGQAGPPTTGDFGAIYSNLKNGAYGRVVQSAWGHKDNTIEANADWDLRSYDSANLKLVIIDSEAHSAQGWHFVAVSPISLLRFVSPATCHASEACRPSTGPCDPAELCTGINGSCPADVLSPDGTACSDGNECTTGDACAANVCVGTCNTGAACTTTCGGHCTGAGCTCQ